MNNGTEVWPKKKMSGNSVDELFYIANCCSPDKEEQIDFYNRILEIDPQNKKAYRYRANAKYDLRDYEEAIADYSYLIDRDPQKITLYLNRADARIKADDFKGALADLKKAANLDPEFLDLYLEKRFQDFKPEHYLEIIKFLMLSKTNSGEEMVCKLLKPTLDE